MPLAFSAFYLTIIISCFTCFSSLVFLLLPHLPSPPSIFSARACCVMGNTELYSLQRFFGLYLPLPVCEYLTFPCMHSVCSCFCFSPAPCGNFIFNRLYMGVTQTVTSLVRHLSISWPVFCSNVSSARAGLLILITVSEWE